MKSMDARCILHHANRKHARTQVAKLRTTLQREVWLFMELEVRIEPLLDSAAARGVCRREGVGAIRHLSTKVHWLQQSVKRGVVTVGACTYAENRADLGQSHSCSQLATAEDRNENLVPGGKRGWTRRD